jgi:hypothetical protein
MGEERWAGYIRVGRVVIGNENRTRTKKSERNFEFVRRKEE